MNRVDLIGRLTAAPELKYTQSGKTFCKFSLAVDRRVSKDSEKTADFIRCVAWGKTAEIMCEHLHKGSKIGISGRLQTGSYEKDGVKHYTTDVVLDTFDFCEKKTDQTGGYDVDADPDVYPLDGLDDDIPFN